MGNNNINAATKFGSDLVPTAMNSVAGVTPIASSIIENNTHQALWEKARFSQEAILQHAIATADITVEHTTEEILGKFDLPVHSRLIMFRAKDMSFADTIFPFIVLPVNPDMLRVAYKKRSDIAYTIGGFVVQHWHDDVITITASGYFPTFRNKAKVLTSSFRAFMSLLNLYRSIGGTSNVPVTFPSSPSLLDDKLKKLKPSTSGEGKVPTDQYPAVGNGQTTVTKTDGKETETQLVTRATVHSIQNSIAELRYQSDVYRGIFTDFSIDEMYEQPNTMKYSFTFKAMEKIDVFFGSLDDNTSNYTMGPNKIQGLDIG